MKRDAIERAREGESLAREALSRAHQAEMAGRSDFHDELEAAEEAAQLAGRAVLDARPQDLKKVKEHADRADRWKRLTAMRLEWAERKVFADRLEEGWDEEGAEARVAHIKRAPGLRIEMEGTASGAPELAEPFVLSLKGLPLVRGRVRFTVVATESPELDAYADGKYDDGTERDDGRKITEAEVGFWKMVKKTGKFVPKWLDLRDHGAAFAIAQNRIHSLETKGDVEIDSVVCQVQVGAFPSRRRAGELPGEVYRRERAKRKVVRKKRAKVLKKAAPKTKKRAAVKKKKTVSQAKKRTPVKRKTTSPRAKKRAVVKMKKNVRKAKRRK